MIGMPQWVEAVDPASGNKYWYDENDTNNVTWDDPRAGAPWLYRNHTLTLSGTNTHFAAGANVAEPMQQNAPEQYEAPPTMGGTATIVRCHHGVPNMLMLPFAAMDTSH